MYSKATIVARNVCVTTGTTRMVFNWADITCFWLRNTEYTFRLRNGFKEYIILRVVNCSWMGLLCYLVTYCEASIIVSNISITAIACHYVLLSVSATIVAYSRWMYEIVPLLKHYLIDYR